MLKAALCLLLLTPQAQATSARFGKKAYGVLLVGDIPGRAFEQTANDARKSLGHGVPLESVSGTVSTRVLQKALDKLQNKYVAKIVVISLSLYSNSPETRQLKYLLGIRETPSKAYMEKWRLKAQLVKRAKAEVPIVWAGGLDSDRAVSEILLEQAKSISQRPKKESIVLVARGAADKDVNKSMGTITRRLGRRIRRQGKFRKVTTQLIRPATKKEPTLFDETVEDMQVAISKLSRKGKVIVLMHLLVADGSGRLLKKKLDNLFYRWTAEGLMPDKRITQWVVATADLASRGPDMVEFEDEGQILPSPKPGKDRKLRLEPW
jgi:hypothetical protein